ncbi:MAG: ribonuclease P protein component [Bacteroidales bacterium]|nr:ribonuclease P protein component [Bacteroidales bacterium]
MNQGFTKDEKLKSRKQITNLFSKNKNVFSYPLKFIYAENKKEGSQEAQLLISVSKRTFKHAVDRNHMKRLIREGYRKNKGIIYDVLNEKETGILLGIIFVGKELIEYQQIEASIIKGLTKLKVSIKKS